MDKIFKKFKFKISIKKNTIFYLSILYVFLVFFYNINSIFNYFIKFLLSKDLYFYAFIILFIFSVKYIINTFKYGELQNEVMKNASNSLETELYNSITTKNLNDSFTLNFIGKRIIFTDSYFKQYPLEYNYFPEKYKNEYSLFLKAILPLIELRKLVLERGYYKSNIMKDYFEKIKEFHNVSLRLKFSEEFLNLLHKDLSKNYKEFIDELEKYEIYFDKDIDLKNLHLLSLVQNEKINESLKFFFLNYREFKRFKREETS